MPQIIAILMFILSHEEIIHSVEDIAKEILSHDPRRKKLAVVGDNLAKLLTATTHAVRNGANGD